MTDPTQPPSRPSWWPKDTPPEMEGAVRETFLAGCESALRDMLAPQIRAFMQEREIDEMTFTFTWERDEDAAGNAVPAVEVDITHAVFEAERR